MTLSTGASSGSSACWRLLPVLSQTSTFIIPMSVLPFVQPSIVQPLPSVHLTLTPYFVARLKVDNFVMLCPVTTFVVPPPMTTPNW